MRYNPRLFCYWQAVLREVFAVLLCWTVTRTLWLTVAWQNISEPGKEPIPSTETASQTIQTIQLKPRGRKRAAIKTNRCQSSGSSPRTSGTRTIPRRWWTRRGTGSSGRRGQRPPRRRSCQPSSRRRPWWSGTGLEKNKKYLLNERSSKYSAIGQGFKP